MEQKYSQVNEVPLADLTSDELTAVKDAETKLNNKYYLIAFQRR